MTERDLLVVGLGSVGKRHARNLLGLGAKRLSAFRERRWTLDADLRDSVREIADLGKALESRPVVFVCNPSHMHLRTALAAARAGCDLFLEKPVATDREGLSELAAECRNRKLVVQVGFQFRFHPGLMEAKRWIDQGRLGKLTYLHASWGEYLPNWHPGEDYRLGYSARRDQGGGALLTLSHPFDYLAWLGGPIASVSARTARSGTLELDVEDIADVGLEFESGAIGQVHLDYLQTPPSHRMTIIGTEGTLSWDAAGGEPSLKQRDGAVSRGDLPTGFERNSMFIDELRGFLRCVDERARPRVDLADGIAALEVALSAHASSEQGSRRLEVRDQSHGRVPTGR